METKDVLLRLRTEKKMTQDELAEKVFVTRQAVSRWEKGETTPNVETLKLLPGCSMFRSIHCWVLRGS
ncbi:MAG: helix-turn-helix transcriptional regulator [Butyricicoccaceae bacterium]